MQITETSADGLKREYTITVPAQDIEQQVQTRLNELSRTLRLPGFRPGKIPMPLVRKRYGQSVMGDVLERAVEDSSQKAMNDRGLRLALQPKIEVTSFDAGRDLEYKMAVELLPDVEPADFSKIELERLVTEVDNAAVDRGLAQLADSRKATEKVEEDRPAETGDVVVVDFHGTVDGQTRDGLNAEAAPVELGSNSFIPGFEDQLVGTRAGEHRTVTVTFPGDYPAADLAGKEGVFEVDVKELRRPLPTVVDDAFAQGMGASDLADLRQKIRERLAQDYRQLSRARLKRALLDALAATHDFAAPEGMVDIEFAGIWRRLEEELKEGAVDPADAGKSEDQLKQEYRTIAERRVRLGLLLSEVGRRNNIQVQQEEMSRAMVAEARRHPGQERQVFEYFRNVPGAMENLRAPLFEDKIVDYILELAAVRERAVPLEELTRDPDLDEQGEAA